MPYLAIMIFMLPAGCVLMLSFSFHAYTRFLIHSTQTVPIKPIRQNAAADGNNKRVASENLSPSKAKRCKKSANRNRSYSLCVCCASARAPAMRQQKVACLSLALPRTQNTHSNQACGLGATFLLFFHAIFFTFNLNLSEKMVKMTHSWSLREIDTVKWIDEFSFCGSN